MVDSPPPFVVRRGRGRLRFRVVAMTEADWKSRCGFHWMAESPVYERLTMRRLALLAVAWCRRFERFWAPLPSSSEILSGIMHIRGVGGAIDLVERWADADPKSNDLGEAARMARDAANDSRVLFEDLVEDMKTDCWKSVGRWPTWSPM